MIQEMIGQITLFDLIGDTRDSSCGKTFQGPLAPTTDSISESFLRNWQELKNPRFQYLCLKAENGPRVDSLTEMVGQSVGEQLTLAKDLESLRDGEEYTLSQTLTEMTDTELQKYALSEKACLGILRRARKRGKLLPEVLKIALMHGANIKSEEEIGDAEE